MLTKEDIELEIQSRKETHRIDFLMYLFKEQRDFVSDTSSRIAALTTRRAGKSFSVGTSIIHEAMNNNGINLLFVGLTKQSASKAIDKDILLPICRLFNIDLRGSKYERKFPNGSILSITGMNASPAEKEKVRGTKYKIIYIDECQSYKQDLKDIIDIFEPCIQDYIDGKIIMTGTPCDDTSTFFYECTKQQGTREPGWSVHEWNTLSNNKVQSDGYSQAEKYKLQIQQKRLVNPLIDQTPKFQQEYLGKWVITTTAKVYKFNDDRNVITDPSIYNTLLTDKKWQFILGIDFGFEDSSALCVVAYHRNDPHVYVLTSEAHQHITITELANRIKQLNSVYHFSHMVGDSAAKQSIAEIAKHHQLPIKPADKLGKVGFISLLNADLITGAIKIDAENNQELIQQMKTLVWDKKKLADHKYVELASIHNDVVDSFLYSWRMSRHYVSKPEIQEPALNRKEDTYDYLKRVGIIPQQDTDSFRFQQTRSERDYEDPALFVDTWRKQKR